MSHSYFDFKFSITNARRTNVYRETGQSSKYCERNDNTHVFARYDSLKSSERASKPQSSSQPPASPRPIIFFYQSRGFQKSGEAGALKAAVINHEMYIRTYTRAHNCCSSPPFNREPPLLQMRSSRSASVDVLSRMPQ